MNQESNNLNQNNFNTQGNNGMSNNQSLQNNQSFNTTFNQNVVPTTTTNQPTFNPQSTVEPTMQPVQSQQTISYEQTIMQEPTPQFATPVENTNNQNLNNKLPKKMNLGLLIGIVATAAVVGAVIGIKLLNNTNNQSNSINKLNVDLEKHDLECVSGDVCNEIKNNIVQIENYYGKINNGTYENYYKIILTSEGNIYLYNSLTKNLFKTSGTTNLKHIEGALDTNFLYKNPLIYGDDKYYSIDEQGVINLVDFKFDVKEFIKLTHEYAWVVDKNGVLNYYISCANNTSGVLSSKCTSDDTWIKLSPSSDLFKNLKLTQANSIIFVTEDGKVYHTGMIKTYSNDIKKDYDNLTYSLNISTEKFNNDYLILNNTIGIWHWMEDSVIQSTDKTLYLKKESLSVNKEFDATISFNEKVNNILFNNDELLIIGDKNVYYAKPNYNDEYELTKLDNLNKYKNNIRGIYMQKGVVYVLLSDGNMYKAY